MRVLGRSLLAAVCLWLGLWSAHAEAASITVTPLGDGSVSIAGDFDLDNQVASIPFSLTDAATVTASMTSQLCGDPATDPCGFIPILTLFVGDSISSAGYLGELTFSDPSVTSQPLPAALLPGVQYLITITVYENYFDPVTGQFLYQDVPGFTDLLFGPFLDPPVTCDGFAQPRDASTAECRSTVFTGSLIVEAAPVPEPGTLLLCVAGCAALLSRRSRAGQS